MRRVLCLVGLVLAFALSAAAQGARGTSAGFQTPKAEVFLGGSYIRSDGANFRGWNASIAANVNDWFGIAGDVSGHYFPPANANIYTYTFGPQISYRKNTKVVPFAHALFGGFHAGAGFGGVSGSINGFAMNLGGGLDWAAHRNFAIRLIQADALITRFAGATSTDARLSVGVVFRFGK